MERKEPSLQKRQIFIQRFLGAGKIVGLRAMRPIAKKTFGIAEFPDFGNKPRRQRVWDIDTNDDRPQQCPTPGYV